MGSTSNISWTDATWNPVTGCTKVSPGCANCYAERQTAGRLAHLARYTGLTDERGHWTGEVRLHPDLLEVPLRWRKPRRIFVCSMSDLFHPEVPFEFIDKVFIIMARTLRHCYQILTKRPERMAQWANGEHPDWWGTWPLPNVWMGTSVESEEYLHRVDTLREIPAAVRFVSFEPLLADLGAVNLDGIAWAIVGAESGPDYRPMEIAWLVDIVAQCKAAGVKTFVKQDAALHPGTQGRIPDDLWALKEWPHD